MINYIIYLHPSLLTVVTQNIWTILEDPGSAFDAFMHPPPNSGPCIRQRSSCTWGLKKLNVKLSQLWWFELAAWVLIVTNTHLPWSYNPSSYINSQKWSYPSWLYFWHIHSLAIQKYSPWILHLKITSLSAMGWSSLHFGPTKTLGGDGTSEEAQRLPAVALKKDAGDTGKIIHLRCKLNKLQPEHQSFACVSGRGSCMQRLDYWCVLVSTFALNI